MIRNTVAGQRLAALFLLGWLLFNYPVMSIFATTSVIAGIPVLYVYLFGVWAALIALMALVVERHGD